MTVTHFIFIFLSVSIRMCFAESCDQAKLYEWEHTRKKFSNPYKKITYAYKLNNSS